MLAHIAKKQKQLCKDYEHIKHGIRATHTLTKLLEEIVAFKWITVQNKVQ